MRDIEALNRRAADLGVTLHQGRHELVDELEQLWLSLFDHHLSAHRRESVSAAAW